jgi:PAS domain S-box-containing protein
MSVLTAAWFMCASASLMLAFMHLLLWFRERRRAVYLLSCMMAASASASAFLEHALLRTESLENYRRLIRWENLAISLILVPMVWFVYAYFGTGRRWLALTITALWAASLVVNFLSPYSVTFAEITDLAQQAAFWGEQFTVPLGSAHPWVWVPNLASALILVFVVDAAVRAWRLGSRRRAAVVGGAITFFIVSAGIHTPLVDMGWVATPYMISFAFLAILLAMSYELVDDAVQASRLTREVTASERRWRGLLENVQLAVVGVDPSGRISYGNPYLLRLLGRGPEDLLGRPATVLVPPEDAAELERRFREAAATGPRPHSQWTLVQASGDRRQLVWSTVRLENGEGDFAGILSIGADVTERLKAERDLRETRGQLERLARANLLGELVSSLAHELNQPLAAILSNAQAARRFLRADPPDLEEVGAVLDDIVRDDKRAGEVIQGVRNLLQRGAEPREPVDMSDAVRESVRLLRNELDDQGVELAESYAPTPLVVPAGRVEIVQVALNLIMNAARALRTRAAGRRRIEVETGLAGKTARLRVSDTGPGVAAELMPRVFEAFATDCPDGLGMGLAIARRIVEAHGGRIWAKDAAGGGAVFSVELPALSGAESQTK